MTTATPAGVHMNGGVRTARITGLLYLGMTITAIFGYFLIRGQLFDAGDPVATMHHLVEHETLARIGIVMELGTVTFQILVALWFYRLFRSVDTFLAGSIAVFGMFNAVAQLSSAAFLATALDAALDPALRGVPATAQLMYDVSGNLWNVVTVFFGLWLVPMGLLVLRSGWMPRVLGWLLITGGVGYVLEMFILYLAPGMATVATVLMLYASLGEFWMMGYLLMRGLRPAGLHAAR